MAKTLDLTGQKFNKLTVIKRAENGVQPCGDVYTRWLCQCDCGNIKIIRTSDLIRGHTKSCGCWNKEQATTHGLKHTRLYVVWRDAKSRCYNPNNKGYKNYGGKGITMCDEWRNDFKVFYDWSMANGYDKDAKRGECTLDRIDNNKGYSPDNCRWVDRFVQANNKCNNRFLTYNGKTHTVTEWSRILEINSSALFSRLKKGWSVERTLTTPLR